MANGKRGDPDILLRHIGPVVSRAVAFAQLFHINDSGFEADGGTEVQNVPMAKFVFGVDAVDGHAGANHVEESVRMLEEAEAGGSMFFAESDAFFFERGASLVKAAELLFVEVWIFGERHHRALDADGLASSEIAHQRSGLMIRHADAADARVDTNVNGDGLLYFGEGGIRRSRGFWQRRLGEIRG